MMYTLDFVKVFLSQGRPLGHHFIACTEINASRTDPRLREKINLIFFSHFFVVPEKVLWRP